MEHGVCETHMAASRLTELCRTHFQVSILHVSGLHLGDILIAILLWLKVKMPVGVVTVVAINIRLWWPHTYLGNVCT